MVSILQSRNTKYHVFTKGHMGVWGGMTKICIQVSTAQQLSFNSSVE